MHEAALALHSGAAMAVGRGIFIWLLFRGLIHAVGWPIALAIFVAVAVGATLLRQRRS